MELNLHNQELKNHISYIIKWDPRDIAALDAGVHTDAAIPTPNPGNINGIFDELSNPRALWRLCISRLRRIHARPPPNQSKHLAFEEMQELRLFGHSRISHLTRGDLHKLREYFATNPTTNTFAVDRSESESDGDVPDHSVNIRILKGKVLLWGAYRAINGHVIRPRTVVDDDATATRDASNVKFCLNRDPANTNDDWDANHYRYGQVLQIVTLKFMGKMHALACVRELRVKKLPVGMHVLQKPFYGSRRYISLCDITELIGLVFYAGDNYVVRHGTAYY